MYSRTVQFLMEFRHVFAFLVLRFYPTEEIKESVILPDM